MEDDIEEGAVHAQRAIVINETQLAELIHEETDAGARSADHLGERFLTELRNHRLRFAFFAEMGQQQQYPREPLLAGVEEMIHQILFDTNRVGEQIGHKHLGERRLLVQHLDHGVFVDAHDPGVFRGGRGRRPKRLSGEAGFPKKAPLFQNRDDGFFALLRDHGQLDLARLDIEHGIRRIPLRKDHVFVGGRQTCFASADFAEERLRIERRVRVRAIGFL